MSPLTLWSLLTEHQKWDFLYWMAFFGGQMMFLLKRIALAVRSPLNLLTSRRQYLYLNWDILLTRTVLEFAIVFYPFRHVPIDTLAAMWHLPFHVPNSAIAFFLLGYLSDSMMDWLAMQDKVLGVTVPNIVKETVPHLPETTVLVEKLKQKKLNGNAEQD